MKKVDSSFLVRLHWSIQNGSCTLNVPMLKLILQDYSKGTKIRDKQRKIKLQDTKKAWGSKLRGEF